MAHLVTDRHILDCIQNRACSKLPNLLQQLKSFPTEQWRLCIQTVFGWTVSDEQEKVLHLLLHWGGDKELWFRLLGKATVDTGEDERFDKELWITLRLDALESAWQKESENADSTPEGFSLLLKRGKESWTECFAYQLAEKILDEHPELSMYISSSSKRSIYHEAAKHNASAILILAESVARKLGKDIKPVLDSTDGTKRTPMAWAIHQNSPTVVETLFHILPQITVTDDIFHTAITSQQIKTVQILGYHRPDLITVDRIREAIDAVVSDNAEDPGYKIWKYLFHRMVDIRKKDNSLVSFLSSSNLLHYAVEKQHANIAKTLVQEYPLLTTQHDEHGRSVLWYNISKPGEQRTESQKLIRELVVTEIIKLLPRTDDIRALIVDNGTYKAPSALAISV